MQTFDVKDPTESWPLTFNMGPDLFSGETLIAPISVTVILIQGADSNPSAILNGQAGFDQTLTQIIQPVIGGIAGCSYEIVVTCPTTNPQKVLTLRGVLPVQI